MVAPSNKRFLLESDKAVANGLATLGTDSKVPDSQLKLGAANGLATLGADAKIPDAQLPTRLGDPALNATYISAFSVGKPATLAENDAALTKAINDAKAAGRGVVNIGPGTFSASAVLPALTAGIAVQGAGSALTRITAPSWNSGFIKASGSLGTQAALTADALPGATTIAVSSTAGIVPGDPILLTDTFVVESATPTSQAGELVRVKAVNGLNVDIYGMVRGSYLMSRTAGVRPVNWLSGVRISGLTIINSAPSTAGGCGILLEYCRDFTINDVRLENVDGPGIQLVSCYGGEISHVSTKDLVDDGVRYGYGINISGATTGLHVSDSTFQGGRHAITTTGSANLQGMPHDILIADCISMNSHLTAFDTHAQGAGITYAHCGVIGSEGPMFQVRARDTRLLDCWGTGGRDVAVYVTEAAHGSAIIGGHFRHLKSHAFRVATAIDRLTFDGVTLEDIGTCALKIDAGATNGRFTNCTVSQTGATQAVDVAAGVGWHVAGNHFDGRAGTGPRVSTGTMRAIAKVQQGSTATIIGNTAIGTNAALPLVEGTDTLSIVNDNRALDVLPVVSKSANYDPSLKDRVILASGTTTIKFPTAVSATNGRDFTVKNIGSGTVTVTSWGGNINGVASVTLAAGASARYVSDGANWWSL